MLVKIYAGLVPPAPRARAAVGHAAVVLLVTAPFLPWGTYIAAFPSIAEALATSPTAA